MCGIVLIFLREKQKKNNKNIWSTRSLGKVRDKIESP